jgi:hypothetical protein
MNFKHYINDRFIVFLNLIAILLAIINVLVVVVRIDTTQKVSVIRFDTTQQLSGFERVPTTQLYQLAIIPLIILAIHMIIAMKLRETNRKASVYILTLASIATVFSIIVATAILNLHR